MGEEGKTEERSTVGGEITTSFTPYLVRHLTRMQRDQLQALNQGRKHTQKEMAEILGCSQPTISRELGRNSSSIQKRYTGLVAQGRAEEKRRQARALYPSWFDDKELLENILTELKDGKSPEQIVGRRKRENKTFVSPHTKLR